MFIHKNLFRNIWERQDCGVSFCRRDLGSFSTARIDESSEHRAVWSRTVEGCFCRELLEAGVDESLKLSGAELLKAAAVGEQLEAH